MVVNDAIRFSAQIYKVQTLVDGGLRVTLDLGENEFKATTELMECKQRGVLIEVAAVAIDQTKSRFINGG